MPLTRRFRETVAKRARSDAAFRAALVEEAVQNILDGVSRPPLVSCATS